MTYHEWFGTKGAWFGKGGSYRDLAPHEHDAGDISGAFSQVRVIGDIYSTNWSGAVPANLAAADAAGTAGFYLDSSAGSAQFGGNLWIGGSATLVGSGKIGTKASGARAELWAADRALHLFFGDTEESAALQAADLGGLPCLQILGPYTPDVSHYAYLILYGAVATADTKVQIGGNLIPDGNTFDLGDSSNSWAEIYAYDILDESGNLRLDLSTLSFGANDSAGAGYRLIRVPNV